MKNIYSFSGPEGLKDTKHPIVFIHGTGMDHTVWTLPMRYFLRKDRNVLGIDLPGHGRSKGKLLETIPEMAKWLLDYLDHLKVNEFSVIGNDEHIKFLYRIFNMMDKAIDQYKIINGFTDAIVEAPAIYLKRIVGDYHKNLHYIEKEFQVRMYYDKRYITDECYPIHIMTSITLRGNRVNIV